MRFDTPLNVVIKPAEADFRFSFGVIHDFSRRGFCFVSQDVNINLKEILEFKIQHPFNKDFVSASGSVVWKKQIDSKYLVGIEFINMNRESKSDILDYSYNLWAEKRQSKKFNCWDFKKCGREEGGSLAQELGTCPALTEQKLNGIHGGRNAGRVCWVVAGTLCGGKPQGTFAKKYNECGLCDFYNNVKKIEKGNFIPTIYHLNKLETIS
jgi:hypothetical protein